MNLYLKIPRDQEAKTLQMAAVPSHVLWLTLLFSLFAHSAQALDSATTYFSTWFSVTEFPNAQTSNVSHWQAEAQQVAWPDLWQEYQHRCINSGQRYPEIGSAAQTAGFVAPARPFDSLFFVGASGVSSWAIDTGDGLILIDSMDNPDQAERVIIPGLQAFGFAGSDVKALIITHEHYDHYGEGTPVQQKVLNGGDVLTIGNTSLQVYATPGHTPGCISLMFPVYDRGEKHLAGLYGGGGIPSGAEDKATQIESFQKFARRVEARGADVLLSNHQTQDHTLQHLDVLANRQCSGRHCTLPNPYIVGTDRYVRYLKVMELGGIGSACVKALAAEGCDVVLHYSSSQDKADAIAKDLRASYPSQLFVCVAADLSDRESTRNLVSNVLNHEQVALKHKSVSVLVANAGLGKRIRDIQDISEDDWDELMEVNARSQFVVTKGCLLGMRAQSWGRIILVGSIASRGGGINGCHYAATKGALSSMGQNLSTLLAPEGVTVNIVLPAMIGSTGMIPEPKSTSWESNTDMEALRAADPGLAIVSSIPVHRLGLPEEIATAVVMMAKTGYMTGQELVLSGGLK
ncbi:hypothetical protein AK830_g1673 [Neonectria ditissima]|uniref:Metallo-beta-lactamase domain-containing protein n=1 Tax=Neonectria ditissima TaxID=78410 RepID=A0A0N8H8L8_9HYPO|nr:hypothetical protein AK830_g1673 [Neonectria ditissima]